jgi:predicted homoserine dehydrogenase-like protein
MQTTSKPLRVAIAGLGAIGKSLATRLTNGDIPGVVLTAVSAKNQDKANDFIKTLAYYWVTSLRHFYVPRKKRLFYQ